jgi:lipid A 3-O-deacylase
MRKYLFHLLFLQVFISGSLYIYAQTNKKASLFRIYEDNDFLNIRGRGTDKAYSGGTRFDLFYHQKTGYHLFRRILKPKYDSSINIAGWGFMQTIFTPNDISDPYFQPNDYFYSGELFIIRSLYSYNPTGHYSFQTELQLGIRGPAALGKQTQTFIHRMIHYTIPMGWDNQLQNAPVINVNFTFEKQVTPVNKNFELIAGGKVYLGTLRNGLTFSPQIRWGLMTPYFNGFISQVSGSSCNENRKKNKIQAYIIIKPEIQLVFNNALLEGGLFAKKPTVKLSTRQSVINNYSAGDICNWVYSINYGAVLSFGKFAISFIQNTSTEMVKGTYSHEVGNISLYFIL